MACAMDVGSERFVLLQEGAIYSATADGRVPFIDAEDVAAVAVEALLQPNFPNGDLVLTGPALLCYDEVARLITQASGCNVVHRRLSVKDLAARFQAMGLPSAYAQALAAMDGAIALGAEERVTDTVQTVTGQPCGPFPLARGFLQHGLDRPRHGGHLPRSSALASLGALLRNHLRSDPGPKRWWGRARPDGGRQPPARAHQAPGLTPEDDAHVPEASSFRSSSADFPRSFRNRRNALRALPLGRGKSSYLGQTPAKHERGEPLPLALARRARGHDFVLAMWAGSADADYDDRSLWRLGR
jgi:hypothetical protein